jgi:electron transfer flavoprotein alpha subunit
MASARFASTLVVADHDNAVLGAGTLSAITAGTKIGGDVTVLVAGSGASAVADAASKVAGVAKVLHVDNELAGHGVAENITEVVLAAQASGNYTHILAPANNNGKNVLPRVAAKLDVAPISDVTGVDGEDSFERPMYAGNVIAKVKSSDAVKVMTVRPTAFDKAGEGGSAAVEAFEAAIAGGKAEFVSEEKTVSDRPDLETAPVVVAGGRGIKSAENFPILEALADKLGAAMGASRAAVDAGFAPNDWQVGQTGKVVAPNLYIAAGISGAIQHVAGMKDSKVIVAINKDEEAPIVALADYTIVDDLFKAVPEMTEKL